MPRGSRRSTPSWWTGSRPCTGRSTPSTTPSVPLPEILASSIGHPLEKAALLVALLRALGYDARVALVAGERGVPLDVPAPVLLEEAWVRVALGPHVLWLDPTAPLDKHNSFSLAGRAVLVLDGRAAAPEVEPELDPATNRAAVRYEVKIEETAGALKLTGREELDLGGLYNPVPAFDRAKDRLAGAAASSASALVSGTSAQDLVVGQKSAQLTAIAAGLSGSIAIPREGRPVRITLPRVPGAVTADSLQLYRNRRTLPLMVPAPAEERVDLVLTLPEGAEALVIPAEDRHRRAGRLFRPHGDAGRDEGHDTDLAPAQAARGRSRGLSRAPPRFRRDGGRKRSDHPRSAEAALSGSVMEW